MTTPTPRNRQHTPLWQIEFGPAYAVPEALASAPALLDCSWHNDVCPSFELAEAEGHARYRLWVDHIDPEMRECGPASPRFHINDARNDHDIIWQDETNWEAGFAKLVALGPEPEEVPIETLNRQNYYSPQGAVAAALPRCEFACCQPPTLPEPLRTLDKTPLLASIDELATALREKIDGWPTSDLSDIPRNLMVRALTAVRPHLTFSDYDDLHLKLLNLRAVHPDSQKAK